MASFMKYPRRQELNEEEPMCTMKNMYLQISLGYLLASFIFSFFVK